MVATLILRDIFGKIVQQAANGPFRLPVHVPVLFRRPETKKPRAAGPAGADGAAE
jgi:hypothetical protein